MSGGFDRIRGGWTHRRLGLGRTRPSDAALAHADALLTEVGSRIPEDLARDLAPDPVRVALLDFVADIDLTIETAPRTDAFDVTSFRAAHQIEMQRVDEKPAPRTRLRDRLLLPAMSAATAAVVLIAVFVVGRSTNDPVGTPSTAAATESRTLLQHASLLLDAASSAQPSQRTELVREARSDLQHVNRLLPLISAPNRPPVRSKLQSLERQTNDAQSTAKPQSTTSGGTTKPSSSAKAGATGSTATTPPAKHQSSNQPPASGKTGSGGSTSGSQQPTRTSPAGGVPQSAPPAGPGRRGQVGLGQGGQGQGGQSQGSQSRGSQSRGEFGQSGNGATGGTGPLGPGVNATS
jgi:hypothetical protein